jgi:hypothetical protein
VTAVNQLALAALHQGVTVELERIFLFYKKRNPRIFVFAKISSSNTNVFFSTKLDIPQK